jgi:hypothetical protein
MLCGVTGLTAGILFFVSTFNSHLFTETFIPGTVGPNRNASRSDPAGILPGSKVLGLTARWK